MTRHPRLARLSESLPVILALEDASGAVAPGALGRATGMPSSLLTYHLDVLRREGWARRRQDGGYRLTRYARQWLEWSLRDHLKFRGPVGESPRTGGSPGGRSQYVEEHPAQPIIRLLSWQWQVVRALERIKSGTSREVMREMRQPWSRIWAARHLSPLVAVGLVARDETPTRLGGPIYTIAHALRQWLDLPMLVSVKSTVRPRRLS